MDTLIFPVNPDWEQTLMRKRKPSTRGPNDAKVKLRRKMGVVSKELPLKLSSYRAI